MAFCSCSPQKEEDNPLYQKGEKALRENRFEDAKNAFTDYLRQNPESWRAHRKLGAIYYEELERPEYAIYHFEQSIILNPRREETPKLQNWCEEARHQLYNQLKREYAQKEFAVRQQMEGELLQLRRTVEQLRIAGANPGGEPVPPETIAAVKAAEEAEAARRHEAEARLAQRMSDRAAAQRQGRSWELPPEPIVATPPPATQPVVTTTPVVTPPVPELPPSPVTQPRNLPPPPPAQPADISAAIASRLAPGDRIHKVKAGETLSAIARIYYGDRSKYPLILKANPKLRSPNLRVGMVIKIPAEKPAVN